jgi:hypothetical protein
MEAVKGFHFSCLFKNTYFMSNIIDSIKLSGVTYTIQGSGGGGNPTVELTQAQYDALVTAGTVQADTYYIITDAQAGDLTNYYTKTETNTLLNGKQATLVSGTNIKTINNESLLGSGNIDIQGGGGGGKAIEAGRGISITTGETADTVSFNLPISAGTGTNSIMEGFRTTASGNMSHAEGQSTTASGINSHAEGTATIASGNSSHAEGSFTKANNDSEHASGQYNISSTASTTFGDSGNTLFSVGNGTADNARHNAFEIRQNGDIYITSGGTDIKLQDNLGGGGSSYSAGTGIDITNNVISVNSGVVTTNKAQDITGNKTFIGSANTSQKPIIFKQANNSHKIGFVCQNTASTNNELATFEFRPDTYTDSSSVNHPLLYIGHYRNTNTANNGIVQTMVGFRQYDQSGGAAYHYLMPLPAEAKTPFSLTTSFKNYFAPLGFKNGSTMITADNTGVVDLSSEFSGKVDTSAITTSITSSSTDAQVPSAKAIYDIIGDIETLLSQI